MASVGPSLLLLLLISSLFLLSNQQPQSSTSKSKAQQVADKTKKFINVVGNFEPLIALIPKAGKYLSILIKIIKSFTGEGDVLMKKLNSEFKNLNQKLDSQLITMTWNTWASGPYQEAEISIKSAWENLNLLVENCKSSCTRQQYVDLFTKLHTTMVFAPQKLHMLLTAQQPSFITDFTTVFTDQIRCHEGTLNSFTQLIDELMYKGTTLSLFYYSLHGINRADELAQIIYETFLVMTNVHRYCVSNPDKYIRRDVFDLIDENQDRQQLTRDVKKFLEKTYDRYNWLVVAFLTSHSNRPSPFRSLNKHFLTGFMEVTKGEVTVAVAKQMKGNHQMAGQVPQFIENCLGKKVKCKDVIEKLNKCPGMDRPLPDLYTAVHVYRSQSHDSAEVEVEAEAEEYADEEQSNHPYIYTGTCHKEIKDGHFRVMIRSDEALKGEDPCKDQNCGRAGKCVRLENLPQGVCECNTGYYGPTCNINKQDLKQALQAAVIRFKN